MTNDTQLMTLRAYARSRRERGLSGGTLAGVQKAIFTHRIQVAERGLINSAEADNQWLARTQPRVIGDRAELRELIGVARGLMLRLERLAGESGEVIGEEPV